VHEDVQIQLAERHMMTTTCFDPGVFQVQPKAAILRIASGRPER